MSVNSEPLNTIIRNSKNAETYLRSKSEDGTFCCWRSEHGQIILSNNNKSSDKFSHSIVPVERQESLSEAVIALQSSFPNKYKYPITICGRDDVAPETLSTDIGVEDQHVDINENEIGDINSPAHQYTVLVWCTEVILGRNYIQLQHHVLESHHPPEYRSSSHVTLGQVLQLVFSDLAMNHLPVEQPRVLAVSLLIITT